MRIGGFENSRVNQLSQGVRKCAKVRAREKQQRGKCQCKLIPLADVVKKIQAQIWVDKAAFDYRNRWRRASRQSRQHNSARWISDGESSQNVA